jgi:hypothetical protein
VVESTAAPLESILFPNWKSPGHFNHKVRLFISPNDDGQHARTAITATAASRMIATTSIAAMLAFFRVEL